MHQACIVGDHHRGLLQQRYRLIERVAPASVINRSPSRLDNLVPPTLIFGATKQDYRQPDQTTHLGRAIGRVEFSRVLSANHDCNEPGTKPLGQPLCSHHIVGTQEIVQPLIICAHSNSLESRQVSVHNVKVREQVPMKGRKKPLLETQFPKGRCGGIQ